MCLLVEALFLHPSTRILPVGAALIGNIREPVRGQCSVNRLMLLVDSHVLVYVIIVLILTLHRSVSIDPLGVGDH
jgi:hypothetical protein